MCVQGVWALGISWGFLLSVCKKSQEQTVSKNRFPGPLSTKGGLQAATLSVYVVVVRKNCQFCLERYTVFIYLFHLVLAYAPKAMPSFLCLGITSFAHIDFNGACCSSKICETVCEPKTHADLLIPSDLQHYFTVEVHYFYHATVTTNCNA